MEVDNRNWIPVSTLGSGSFGIVQLWKNRRNGEEIAIKRCKSTSAQLSPKQKERWIHEVVTMKGLRHPNVVASKPLPPELVDPTESSLPVLCMEYCKKGDLRRVLNDVENCCGLPETVAIQIMLDISAAVEYLHEHSLTHRDLKPENIVLQQINNKVVYKLIDLGYAKILGHESVDASIVGTMNYVAPELLWKNKYTRSVDYWSLGILFYEIITGSRPFLPEEDRPVVWKLHIEKKTSRDISARYVDGSVQFQQDIREPNYISPIIRDELVEWFRIVLQWDSKQRGWGVDENGVVKIVVFEMLRRILSKKVVRVFCVHRYDIFHYELKGPSTIRGIQTLIENDTQVIISSQEILNSSGEVLSGDEILKDTFLTLFKKEDIPTATPPNTPEILTRIILSSKVEISYHELKRCYSTALFFVKQEVELFRYYILALSMKIDLITSRISSLSKKKSDMMPGMSSLQAQFVSTSELLNSDTRNGFAKWQREIEVASSKLDHLSTMINDLESRCDKFSRIYVALREFGDNDWMEKHQKFLDKVQDVAESSRSLPRFGKHVPLPMAQLIAKFQKFRHERMNDQSLLKIGSQIGLMTTAPATEDLSKLEKYVESATALTAVYRQEISNLNKTWDIHRQTASSEKMDIEHNDNNSEIDAIISDDVIFDNLVIRYMIHDVMSETYEKFSKIVNLNPDEAS